MTGSLPAATPPPALRRAGRAGGWLRGSRAGLLAIALVVGAGSGLGAVAFRSLIYLFTWLATGHVQFGQQGRVPSTHLPWLGLAFFVVIPVIGGLIYGPLIYRYAREARGHGVPEVMIAVADEGGRIRPQVAAVKSVASALCIGAGGSVGREGPIVQIGSALASSLGQWVKMPETRLRILVACGAAGGIAATFNAPITGVFFGVELILREFSIEAIFTVMLSAMVADLVSRQFLGSAPFLSGLPSGIALHHLTSYLLVAALAVVAALLGLAFAKILYATEDLCDKVWGTRPEWARPAIGGIALGLLLLALPQMYGVGYPVLYKAVGGSYALWFLIVLAAGKIIACSLTIGIGGSGGVFAPSLFIGATSGMAFGEIAGHLLGPAAGQPALYAVVAMGAVFASAARAPLTAVASVVEMTGDFTLTLPVLLAVAIATATSRALSYGTIYTTKLLRRGIDIDRTRSADPFEDLTAADAMRPFPAPLPAGTGPSGLPDGPARASLPGPVTHQHYPQVLFATESLTQALRQLELYGRDGLPVIADDGQHLQGWITTQNVLQAVARHIRTAQAGTAQPQPAAGPAPHGPMYKAVGGSYALWFLIILAAGKIIACSLTIGIGGSGGVFAPSLFIGATSGMAFGDIANHLLGPAAGQPALYAVVAMGAVFASAARAPLTSVASVVELTGDYTLTLPVMLAVAIATAASRALSYGTIYTTKLLRRGTDIDHPPSADPFEDLTAADAMHPFAAPLTIAAVPPGPPGGPSPDPAPSPGPVTHRHHPQMLFATESLTQALRQLELYGRDGLPVISADGQHLQGWITSQNVLQAVARHMHAGPAAAQAPHAAHPAVSAPPAAPGQPPDPLPGYQILEITISAGSPAAGHTLGDTTWPPGWIPVTVLDNHTLRDPDPRITLTPGDRVNLLAREPHNPQPAHPHDQPASPPDGRHPDAPSAVPTPSPLSGEPPRPDPARCGALPPKAS